MEISGKNSLPENAYRKLEPGEEYIPVIPAEKIVPELTPYSLFWGLFYTVLFSAACAYLGLKIGQVFEAAIPITILAIGMSNALKRSQALQENVIIQSIGSTSGLVVAGAIFTVPGLYILGLDQQAGFWRIFMASLLGGVLGMLFLIPFRRYFVKEMHGEFPFPEATASTEVLMAGESGGDQASVLIKAGVMAGIYNFLSATFGLWRERVSTMDFVFGRKLASSVYLEFRILVDAAVIGLGYIVGLKYTLIIACGSFLAWWVIVPAVGHIGKQFGITELTQMTPGDIFADYVRHIGIGTIAMAGMIGVYKSRSIIFGAFKLAFGQIGKAGGGTSVSVERTQRDLPMPLVWGLIGLTLLVTFVFFWFGVTHQLGWAITGLLIVAVISFLFTTVAARAIAIVGTNPVSGMTLMTLIISSVFLNMVGLEGNNGIVCALLIGGVVCTALSMSGGFVSDLKIGYWLGTTPKVQQQWKFLGTLFAAAAVAGVIMMLNKTYGFGANSKLEAPQATVMAEVIKPLMTGEPAPWLMYMGGCFMALILEWVGVPPLAFALGMYLPLHLNTPILAGGLVSYFSTRGKSAEVRTKRKEKGTLMASGFVAGGAIMGVVSAFVLFIGQMLAEKRGWSKVLEDGTVLEPGDWSVIHALGLHHWAEENPLSSVVALALFLSLCLFLWRSAKNAASD
ncbi:MAG: oligopeptide transporter, OPT family [bacterium]